MPRGDTSRLWALIPAAGTGSRMGAALPKQYLDLDGRTVLERTIARLAGLRELAGMVVVLRAGDDFWPRLALPSQPGIFTAVGGAERCHSVLSGLEALSTIAAPTDWVLVHDAARPCVRVADIDRLVHELDSHPVGGLLGLPVSDTIKRADAAGEVMATVDRSGLWRALTPQMFRLGALRDALRQALAAGVIVTDEAAAMEYTGQMPRMIEGSADNLKITRPEDLARAALFLRQQAHEG